MKRIFKWLETKFSRHSAAVEADERHTPVDKYVSHDTITQPVLRIPVARIREESSYEVIESTENEVIESTGFDPYNSGSFESSKSRSRK